ncbi:MAG: hypothetical protein LBG81_04915 [Coriobacteriaceae bacterium]|jgi:hypothetical protein|nr:hypothetical protein [Coriobacteriaceae bacterium]
MPRPKFLKRSLDPDPRSLTRFITTLTIFALISLGFFWLTSLPHDERVGDAVEGVLDLRDRDFSHSTYTLSGQWEFYYGMFLTPQDFEQASESTGIVKAGTTTSAGSQDDRNGSGNSHSSDNANGSEAAGDGTASYSAPPLPEGTFIHVPQSWSVAGFPLYGYATYRLTLLTEGEQELSIYFPEIPDSSIVYVNGEKMAELGHPAATKEETVTAVRNYLVHFWSPSDGRTEIIVQAANYGWFVSGLSYFPIVGKAGPLFDEFIGRRVMLGIVIGILFAMFLYQIFLYSLRHKKVYLAFALTCLAAALQFLTATNNLVDIFSSNVINKPMRDFFYAMLLSQAVTLTFFTYEVFLMRIRRSTLLIFAACFCLPYLAYLFLPYGMVNVRVVLVFYLVPMMASFVNAIRLKRIRANRYNKVFLAALALSIVWYPLQAIIFGDHLFMPGVLPSLFLLLCQGMVVVLNYVEIERHEKELRAQNSFYYRMAHDLMTPITKVSTNIQIANMSHETDHERLTRSQEEIMGMKRLLDLALNDNREDDEKWQSDPERHSHTERERERKR